MTGEGAPTKPWVRAEIRMALAQASKKPAVPADTEPDLAEPARVVVEEFTDSYVLASDDFGKVLIMNAAVSKTFTLPAVLAADVGLSLTLVKKGAGALVIQAGGTDTFNGVGVGSSAGGTIYNDLADELYAVCRLRVVDAGAWLAEFMTGYWRPT